MLATLRDYEGTSSPLETRLKGTLHESAKGCEVSLAGSGKRGKVEICGIIIVADFQGTISRLIGKKTLSEKVALRRRRREPNERIEAKGSIAFEIAKV